MLGKGAVQQALDYVLGEVRGVVGAWVRAGGEGKFILHRKSLLKEAVFELLEA